MSKNKKNTSQDLRDRAEALLAKSPDAIQLEDIKDVNQLAHELAVHQAELELQNEELRNTQLTLQKTRDRFTALFEHAPVGYVVLDASGIIRQTNVTWRVMLDRPEEDFRGKPFVETLVEEDAPIFLSRFRAFFRNPEQKHMIVRIKRKGGTPFHGQIEAKPRDVDVLNDDTDPDQMQKELMVIVSDVSERRHMEEALSKSEARFRSFVENANDLVYALSPEGRFTYVSPNWLEFMGEPTDKAIGHFFEHYVHPDDVDSWRGFLKKLFSTGEKQSSSEYRVRHGDGSWHWQVTNGSPLLNAEDKIYAYIGIARDVTSIRKVSQRLQQSEELLDATGRMARIGGWELDVQTRQVTWTKATYEIHEVPFDHKPPLDEAINFFHPDDRPCLNRALQDAVEHGTPYDLELRFFTAKGRQLITRTQCQPVIEKGNVTKLRGTFYDITDLRRAEGEISTIFDMSLVMICIADLNSSTFVRVNSAFTSILGYDEEELYSRSFLEFIHPDDVEETQRLVSEMLQRGEKVLSFVNRYRHKDGTYRWLAWNSHPRPDLGITYATAIDISEQREMQERLRQMEKMDAIGQLAGGVAHDFNNQLAGIVGYADMLLSRLKDPELHQFTEKIMVAANRAGDLTQKLLAFARKGQYESVPVDIHSIIEEVVGILHHSIDKRIKIKPHLIADPSITKGDPGQIQNALLNLAINASDSMQKGGTLVFETAVAELDADYCVSIPYEIEPGSYVRISISDTGCGISSEDLEHIFEPFFTTKEVGKGTGMGLAAVYGTVKQHGGAINVYSEVGHGTIFRVYLPMEKGVLQPLSVNHSVIKASRPASILIVDDEEMVRELIQAMLLRLGYQVHTESDGASGVAYFEKHWQDIDLVILDMVMPNLNGPETFRTLQKINPEVKVLLASGYSINGAAQGLMIEGVLGFIQKPFQYAALSSKVAQIIEEISE